MRPECIKAVSTALGRELNQVEARDIEQRIVRNLKTLARDDPQAWLAKPRAVRFQEAGQRAAAELVHEAQLKAEREALQIAANARVSQGLADHAQRGVVGLDALDRIVAFHADGKYQGLSIESQAAAIRNDFMRQLIPVMEASNPKWFGLLENREGVEAIIRELMHEDSGNPVAKAGAKVWHRVAEAARERMNAAGGDIGKLEDYDMPHHHSQAKVAGAARSDDPDANRSKWVADIMPLIKRERYVNEDGSRMTDQQIAAFLGEAWTSIATGGANKMEPGKFVGDGMRANRGSASRQIHFKDAQSYIDYQNRYGERSLYEVLTGHIDGIAKDIALVETLGPNPDHAFRMHRDAAVQQMTLADPRSVGDIQRRAVRSENLYNVVSGRTQPVASERLANTFDTLRNWLTASRLGGAVISSFTDEATLHLTARLNNLPQMKLLANQLATLNPANKMEERMAMRAGLALNTFISTLNRFGQDNLNSSFSKRLATTVLRATGLNAATEARRRAYGVTQMGALGGVAKDHATLGKIDPKDAEILKRKGVTDEDFAIWKAANLEDWGGGNDTMLTPDSIYRIPDAKIDAAIGPRLQKMKDDVKAELDELAQRDVDDRKWVQNRAAKLSAWLGRAQVRVGDRIAKAEGRAKQRLEALRARISKLEETVEGARGAWDTPPDADTPGVRGDAEVRFYGKGKLRGLGMDEGRAREAMRGVERDIRSVRQAFEKTKVAERDALFEDFQSRRDELEEFTKGSQQRIGKRAKVAERIQRDLLPAIERARVGAREKAVTRLLGMVLEETNMAVIEPGAKERAMMGSGLQRGTWKGELMRSFFLFKSFPLAMMTRHWARGMAQATGKGRAVYLASLIAGTTLLGAMAMQVKEVLAGRDPRNLNPFRDHGVRNWMKAMLQGGSLGLYGDFLFSEASQYGRSPTASMAGPVVGAMEEAFNLTQGNILQALSDKDTHAGAEALKFVQSNIPGQNVWYTKAVMDHLIWQRLAEHFSPGYLRKMRRRAEREFGQSYWWEPGQVAPTRAPDVTAVAGE